MKKFLLIVALCLTFISRADAGTFVQIRLPIGDIELELYDQDKPVTVKNFIRYIQSGRYTNTFVQRWEPGFVIQGGGRMITNRTTPPEFKFVPIFGTITNEYSIGTRYSNLYGTIAMARAPGVTNSATSQWFINLGNNSNLDNVEGGFTVFGRVVGGFSVLDQFNMSTDVTGIFRQNLGSIGPDLTKVPVLSQTPTYNDYVHTDISLLNVKVTRNGNNMSISWNSVNNRPNVVEYTTVFPPTWQTLNTVTGNGSNLSVTDSNPQTKRFYRVRVNY